MKRLTDWKDCGMNSYDYYSANYVESSWKIVSEDYVVKRVLRSCPELSEILVRFVLRRDGDGKYFGFEVSDWIKYFKQRKYIK